MKLLKTLPKSGQFIATWVYNEEIWSSTYKWSGDSILVYNKDVDQFWEEDEDENLHRLFDKSCVFIVKDVGDA